MTIKKQAGFTLVELMITMAIFVFVIAAASNMFVGVLNQFKQQSKISESNIEGNIGLQMLRTDIEQAGFGLPYALNGATYSEAAGTTPAVYNDASSNAPRAIVVGDDVLNGLTSTSTSDYLVVKSTSVATSSGAHKWAYISNRGASNILQTWTDSTGAAITGENLQTNDRVIVLRPASGSSQNILVRSSGEFTAQFNSNLTTFPSGFQPTVNSMDTYLVYGVTPPADPVTTALRMPFNRADYYIKRPTDTSLPVRCAPHTGILYKGTVNHADGLLSDLPLLDCVLDMQIAFGLDMNEDGTPGTFVSPDGSPLASSEGADATKVLATLADPSLIRKRLKEIRVYILSHEGQKDSFYTYPNATITLTDQDAGDLKAIDLNAVVGPTYVNYRWKVYTLVIKPFNLR